MEELVRLVRRAQTGDGAAYDRIVRRFQDRAVGYAYSVLGDWHGAEDAAQDAFLQAFRDLPALREAAAFPAWLRRLIFKHCDRRTRRRQVQTLPPNRHVHSGPPRERRPTWQTAAHCGSATERAAGRGVPDGALRR